MVLKTEQEILGHRASNKASNTDQSSNEFYSLSLQAPLRDVGLLNIPGLSQVKNGETDIV